MEKKYELIKDDTIEVNSFGCLKVLYRIKALKDFNDVKKGDLGGYIEKEDNLGHEGNCWICGDARVFGKALICGDARVFGKAQVFGGARVYGNAKILGNSMIGDEGNINSNNDYINMGPIGDLYATFYIGTHDNIKIVYNQNILTIDEFINSLNRNFNINDECKNQYIGMIEYVKGILINRNSPDCDENKESDATNTHEDEVNDALKLIRGVCKNTKHCENCILSKDGKKCGIADKLPMYWKLRSDVVKHNLFI